MRLTPRRSLSLPRRSLIAACLVLCPLGLLAPDAHAQDRSKKRSSASDEDDDAPSFRAWGKIKPVRKTDFYTLSYTATTGGRRKKQQAFVRIADAEVYVDRMIRLGDLSPGDTVWILGRLEEKEVPGVLGVPGGVDRQIKNVSGVVLGEAIQVPTGFKDPRDPDVQWHEGSIENVKSGLVVSVKSDSYKVVLNKSAPILRRQKKKDDHPPKSGSTVEVVGEPSDERPETKKQAKDAKKQSIVASRVVVLERRLVKKFYPKLFPR